MTRQEYKDIYDVVGAAMEVYNTLDAVWLKLFIKNRWLKNSLIVIWMLRGRKNCDYITE